MSELAPREIKIPKDMVAWILRRLNSKDASGFMLALSVGKPLDTDAQLELEHTHQWIPGGTYKHTHKKGDIPHGHHGSRYVAKVKQDPVCPECRGRKWNTIINESENSVTMRNEPCPTCQGKHSRREKKIRDILIENEVLDDIDNMVYYREKTARQIQDLFDGEYRITFPNSETAVKWLKQNEEEIRKQERERIEGMLSISENELGFVEISNHIPYEDWKNLKEGE